MPNPKKSKQAIKNKTGNRINSVDTACPVAAHTISNTANAKAAKNSNTLKTKLILSGAVEKSSIPLTAYFVSFLKLHLVLPATRLPVYFTN